MEISYESTRGGQKGVTASQAVLQGLAQDGGLFMPTEFPRLDKSLKELAPLSYQETAYEGAVQATYTGLVQHSTGTGIT